jgi:hypothetical protein
MEHCRQLEQSQRPGRLRQLSSCQHLPQPPPSPGQSLLLSGPPKFRLLLLLLLLRELAMRLRRPR